MIRTVLFDLDGTLLPLDQDTFVRTYVGLLSQKMAAYGYDPKAFANALLTSSFRVLENDGSRSNEAMFTASFSAMLGEGILQHFPTFDAFYRTEFEAVRAVCGYTPEAAAIVHALKAAGVTVALATNPVFPQIATYARIRWAGLSPEDFAYVTTYENSTTCKPNPAYYLEVADHLGVDPSECLMVGNDTLDDLAAAEAGMKVFLLTDCLLLRKEVTLDDYPHGDFSTLRRFLTEASLL